MLKTIFLALKNGWRDGRKGEWTIVFFSLLMAIAAITSIQFYTDRLTRAFDSEGAKFLGGDLAISSATPIPSQWLQQAKSLNLKIAEVWSFPSVINVNQSMQLVNVQAVSQEYPIIGNHIKKIKPNTLWVEPRLLTILSLKLQDGVKIGVADFTIVSELTPDVDTLNTGLAMAPRVMMSLSDVPSTRTVLPGSRVDYRLLLTGKPSSLKSFAEWVTPQFNAGQRLIDVRTQTFAVKTILERAENYIQLTLLICLVMTGVAITLSIQQYLRKHYTHIALWRCLGAKRSQIIRIYLFQLFIIALGAGLLGVLIGFIAQEFFVHLFKNILQLTLPAVSYTPMLIGFLTSTLILFAFAYPVISELPHVSPLYLWRNELGKNSRSFLYRSLSILAIFIFVYGFMGFSLVALLIMNSLIIGITLYYLLSIFLLKIVHHLASNTEGSLRRGLSQLVQYSDGVSLQFVGFTIILSFLLVLTFIRTDLINHWRASLPKNTPNYFAFNIAPTDLASFKQFFAAHRVSLEGIYPMVRGRLIALNGQPILSAIPPAAINNNALHRELNLSWMVTFPSDNKIVKGPAWNESKEPLVSVEVKLAEELGLRLGDELTFQMGDQFRSARIANFRQLDWSSFHPNFFMIFTPGGWDRFATTYITSLYLSKENVPLLKSLLEQFPNVTIIDVANLLKQLQDLLEKIIIAIQYLFIFALVVAIMMFIASLQATLDERRQTYSLLHVLGAKKGFIRKSMWVEWSVLLTGIILTSFISARVIVFLLERKLFQF